MMPFVIGIDVGTSGCKIIAVDKNGTILTDATAEYPVEQPQPGWSEQNPELWWDGTKKALRDVLKELDLTALKGISFSGQMHGMVALDADHHVVRNAILWNDQRTSSQCDTIVQECGGLENLLSFTNNMMLTGYTGGKILWMKEMEPQNYDRTKVVIMPKDYIRFRLTDEICTDVSDASGTGFFDVRLRNWSDALIQKIGLRRSIFPKFVESTAQTGCVTQKAAEETGLPAGIPVYGGGGDAVISTTGMGLAIPGRVGITLGTSGVVATGLPHFVHNPDGKLQLFCGNAPNRWTAFGCTLAAAGSYQWFRGTFGKDFSYAALDQLAQNAPAGSDGLIFLPYLTGERCPVFDPQAKGAFLGIHSLMGMQHFTRAVLEGVCFSMKQVYDMIVDASPQMQNNNIIVSGGGARSPLWRQMLADIFALPVSTVYGSAQGGAFGAAMVAGAGCGLWNDIDEAMSLARPDETTLPNPENFDVYQSLYQKYCKFYEAIRWSFS